MAVEELASHLDQSLAALREQQREALRVERDSLDRAIGRLQAEQAGALDAMANEATRDLAAAKEVSERERREATARLAEDQEHRARVNQADLRRLEQHTSDMRALLVNEREQWAAREAKAKDHSEEVLREVRDSAYEQASVEHDRVLREAAAHGAEMTSQHEAALVAALAQKDEQLGARLSEYEGQLAKMVTERAALQTSAREALTRAAADCDAARAELESAQSVAEHGVSQALSSLGEATSAAMQTQYEELQRAQRALNARAIDAVGAQASAGESALIGRLDEIQQEASARHRHTATALGEAVKALHVRRETELSAVAAEHAKAISTLREEYERQLKRMSKLADEVLVAERAKAEQDLSDAGKVHEGRVAELETEKEKLREERTKGWAHLPLPDLLRQAMDEGLGELKGAHTEEVERLLLAHAEQMERLQMEKVDASEEARSAIARQGEVAENELALSLGEARLQHEEERTRLMEELNGRAEAELSALRDEQTELAKRHLASESKRVASEESARVASEIAQLRTVIGELEAEGAKGAELRARLAENADGALLAEVERLSNEVRQLKASKGNFTALSGAAGAPAAAGPLTPNRRPPTAKAAAPAAARPASRGRGRA